LSNCPGTQSNQDLAPIPSGVMKVVNKEKTRAFRKYILDCDVIIYDLMTNDFEEVDYVIKTLKTTELEGEKTLILVSSVMSWVNTPPKFKKEAVDGEEEEGEPEEEEEEPEDPEEGEENAEGGEDAPPKRKILPFNERDFYLRVPSQRFKNLKSLETIALSSVKTQPNLKVWVLCSGILYGNGERIFYEHFKRAWLQSPASL
jgi:adenylate kinase